MKILELGLLAYGPFTGKVLDFSGNGNFHLVYGDNEAGKSSALRALFALLFDYSHSIEDDFVHPGKALRVGGRLVKASGEELRMIRRRGQKGNLRDGKDEKPVEEEILRGFLNGISREEFETIFGLNHKRLVKGGEEILKGEGKVGETLFAAGAGLTRLHAVLEELDKEAGGLFKPSGQNPEINSLLRQMSDLQKSSREAMLSIKDWEEHDRLLRESEKRKSELEKTLREYNAELERWKRQIEALPLKGKREDLLREIADLGEVPSLRKDFTDQRIRIQETLVQKKNRARELEAGIEDLTEKLDRLEVPEDLLAREDTIDRLYREMESSITREKDIPKLKADIEQAEKAALEILRSLKPGAEPSEMESFRISTAERERILEMAEGHKDIENALTGARKDVLRLEKELGKREESLAALPPASDVTGLERAAMEIQGEGPLEKQLDTLAKEIEAERDKATLLLGCLDLWSGTPEEALVLKSPLTETIDRFETRIKEAESALKDLQKRVEEKESEKKKEEKNLASLEREGNLPNGDKLGTQRRDRDETWRLVRDRYIEGTADEKAVAEFLKGREETSPLPDVYEKTVARADETSDRLIREADRVTRYEHHRARIHDLENESAEIRDQVPKSEEALREIEEEWRRAWNWLEKGPLSPREMRAWLLKLDEIRGLAEDIRKKQADRAELETRIETYRKTLLDLLPDTEKDADLKTLLVTGQSVLDKAKDIEKDRKNLGTQIEDIRSELEEAKGEESEAEKNRTEWIAKWGKAIAPLGLTEEATPGQARAVLEDVNRMFESREKAKEMTLLVREMEESRDLYAASVKDLCLQVATDLAPLPPEQAAERLNRQLTEARTKRDTHRSLDEQLDKAREDYSGVRGEIEELGTKMELLCQEAGCKDPADLPEIENRVNRHNRLQEQLSDTKEQLREKSGGHPLEDFLKELAGVNVDALPGAIEKRNQEIEELERERSELDQKIGEERNILAGMDGSGKAAQAAQEVLEKQAHLVPLAERYALLTMASAILRKGIERYREKHQGPILSRAGDIFAGLTCGSFSGLKADFDEKGESVLRGIRAKTEEDVPVEGLSDGTRDQLFLSLRLAALHEYLERNPEPLPLIVDDILINFDDRRAKATLKALGDLSEKTQVIFFTHHARLAELAEGTVKGCGRVGI